MATAFKKDVDPADPIADLGIKLISADNHINEPRDLFTKRFPAHLKDKAPRVIDGKDGGEGWSIDGKTRRSAPAVWRRWPGSTARIIGSAACATRI